MAEIDHRVTDNGGDLGMKTIFLNTCVSGTKGEILRGRECFTGFLTRGQAQRILVSNSRHTSHFVPIRLP